MTNTATEEKRTANGAAGYFLKIAGDDGTGPLADFFNDPSAGFVNILTSLLEELNILIASWTGDEADAELMRAAQGDKKEKEPNVEPNAPAAEQQPDGVSFSDPGINSSIFLSHSFNEAGLGPGPWKPELIAADEARKAQAEAEQNAPEEASDPIMDAMRPSPLLPK